MAAADAVVTKRDRAPVSPAGRRYALLVITLGLLHTLGTLTVDIYLPAFPLIGDEFDASQAVVQFTFTGAMVGMMFGQLTIGPWSDRVGRRLPLVLSSVAHVAASVLCATAPTIEILIAARFLQGAASAATVVVTIAIVRDLFIGTKMLRLLANLALIYGTAIVVGPFLGSQLLLVMDWRGVFFSLAGYAAVIGILAASTLAETLPASRRRQPGLAPILASYRAVALDRQFMGLSLVGGFAWGGMYAYLSSSSFLFQQTLGLSQWQYGLAFASHAVFMLAGSQLASLAITWWPARRLLAFATVSLLVAPVALLLLHGTGWGLWAVLPPLWLFTLALGIAKPCVQTLAMSRVTHHAGVASSLLGGLNTGVGALATPLVGLIGITSAVPVAAVMIGFELLAVLALVLVGRPATPPRHA
ncbi:multidrug effflux MFS transporter [Microbacterium oleivorans]|uniref:Multidrug effflux MFS transporter n=1 Tax=Microbacterium oleivorans TaxID=273677 RepID=A0A7D5JXQ1_9MICO|nr:multidrug effflux MFS transporter [Microbacterium oleivorans]QLD11203.1 multidrug effflux MFS transporter [Microbacterium oleivorans]